MKNLIFIFIFLSTPAWAQYYPRGTSFNDGYWPNLDEPDKWIVSLDGMFDWQKDSNDAAQVSDQTTHFGVNVFYGGQIFRGGLQVLHDNNRSIKDLSLGAGLAYNRPFFIEAGIGYLSRVAGTLSSEGWSYNVKVGYYYNWIMQVKYRVRVRISLMYNHKTVNELLNPVTTNFYPFIGFEFET